MSKQTNITHETIGLLMTGLAQVSPLFNELIPSFTTRYVDRLDRCFAAAGEQSDAIAKVSTLYYLINKERPFATGNKRIALAVLLYLLAQEGKWLKASPDELYDFAHWVGMAPMDAKEEVITYIEKFIRKHEVKNSEERRNK